MDQEREPAVREEQEKVTGPNENVLDNFMHEARKDFPAHYVYRVPQCLLEPYAYITEKPGKNVRTKLIQAFNLWLEIPEDKIELISEVTKMLHNASLLYVHGYKMRFC